MQSAVFQCAFTSNENMLVCAPTGAGKTDVAMMVVLKVIHDHLTLVGRESEEGTADGHSNTPGPSEPLETLTAKGPQGSSDPSGSKRKPRPSKSSPAYHIALKEFKMIYIAPMKALAAEIVAKFSRRLSSLRIVAKEYTGDMQLTKEQVSETQLIVTTPEKWDVITRKGLSESGLLEKVKLIVMDEVHLLHDDRGPVLEALVARTLRQVEQSQTVIRIVGLSATLPNYVDVAAFLRVNPYKGLFYFDQAFRPVPLTQQFVGVKRPSPGSSVTAQQHLMNEIAFDKAVESIRNGHQVMVFVHSRNETSKTAKALLDMVKANRCLELFERYTKAPSVAGRANPQALTKELALVKSKELRDLMPFGIGIHHAGLLRGDRNIVEKLFGDGQIRLLCCTATLAWGVNLPAHTVIIKGTQLYDANKGDYVDLGILDVLQIFGRAGRPQFETHGEGILMTSHDRLSYYLTALTQPIPIESQFIGQLTDHLNAEVALGTVSTLNEALSWLKYTYLWVRMRKNPVAYGIGWKDIESDPSLEMASRRLIEMAAIKLHELGMIQYEPLDHCLERQDEALDACLLDQDEVQSESWQCTVALHKSRERGSGLLKARDMGRIASLYYLRYTTLEAFRQLLMPHMSDAALLAMIARATEFEQLKVRDADESTLHFLVGSSRRASVQTTVSVAQREPSRPGMSATKLAGRLQKELQLRSGQSTGEVSFKTSRWCPIPVLDDLNTVPGKVCVLLQAHVSGWSGETASDRSGSASGSMISDLNYVAQNAGRFVRALFEIAHMRGWAPVATRLLELSKCIEHQQWMDAHPLAQVPHLRPEILAKLAEQSGHFDMATLKEVVADFDASTPSADRAVVVPALVPVLGQAPAEHASVLSAVRSFPYLSVQYELFPLTRTILRVNIGLSPDFTPPRGGSSEPFWIWLVDPEQQDTIAYSEFLVLNHQGKNERGANDKNYIGRHRLHRFQARSPDASQANMTEGYDLAMSSSTIVSCVISIPQPPPPCLLLQILSDRWLGADAIYPIPIHDIIWPEEPKQAIHTELMDLRPLPVSVLCNPILESYYRERKRLEFFNSVQTQAFHTLYYKTDNVLLGAPTGSGKTISAELALWNLFRSHARSTTTASNEPATRAKGPCKAVYIAPLKALIKERMADWQAPFAQYFGLRVVECTGDVTPDSRALLMAHVIVTTPEKWDGLSRHWQLKDYMKLVKLVIIDEIHLLGGERGPVLEAIISRWRFMAAVSGSVRFVGLSTALANAVDLADWLDVKPTALFNFRPSVRPIPLSIHISGFSGRHYFSRMESMNKPAYGAILTYSAEKPVLIFVSSRRQTRVTAQGLISLSNLDEAFARLSYGHNRRFLWMSETELNDTVLPRVSEPSLRHALTFGIGLHHAGLPEAERRLVETLFTTGKIQVLVATSTLAWGVNFPAHLVIIKGTEYFDARVGGYVDYPMTDILQMMGRAGRPQFDTSGTAVVYVSANKKSYYKKFLFEPFPVESSLHHSLADALGPEITAGLITKESEAFAYLSWTYLARRYMKNPVYYGNETEPHCRSESWAHGLVRDAICELVQMDYMALVEPEKRLEAVRKPSKGPRKKGLGREGAKVTGSFEANEVEDWALVQDEYVARPLGRIATMYYVSYRTLRTWSIALKAEMASEKEKGKATEKETETEREKETLTLTPTSTPTPTPTPTRDSLVDLKTALWLICQSSEYDLMPVRHHEDISLKSMEPFLLFNLQRPSDTQDTLDLSGLDLHRVKKDPMYPELLSPNVKAFYLLQTLLLGEDAIEFPIVDFSTDLATLMDQFPRLAQAFLDVVAEFGLIHYTLATIHLLQCIGLKLKPYSSNSILAGLPHVAADDLRGLQKWGIEHLPQLLSISEPELEQLFGAFKRLRPHQVADIVETICQLPSIDLTLDWSYTKANRPVRLYIVLRSWSLPPKAGKGAGTLGGSAVPIMWWILLTHPSSNSLVCLKKLPPHWHPLSKREREVRVSLDFQLPSMASDDQVCLYLLTDGYYGLDQEYRFSIHQPST